MNKTAIKNFAVWARNKLIAEVKYKAGLLGITENGIAKELPESDNNLKLYDIGTKEPAKLQGDAILQRANLAIAINRKAEELGYKEAFEYVMEEVAYSWFNRLIAIRFMEVNDYLPSGVRVLSSESAGKKEPDMVTTPFETDIDFSDRDREIMQNLKDDELFRFLFIKQCNKLNEYLPELFEQTNNYTELLLPISFRDEDGIIYHLVNDISEEDFKEQVQIIGWLYQYYNTEPKDKVFANLKKNVKISKENIPAATQLFTPDWIVRYMVENSLGRLWVDGHADYDKSEWKYYLAEAEQEESVKAQLDAIREENKNISVEEIKFLEPCMGSGHILVYAYDVFMQIYLSQGYNERDAAQKIIENNLFGLELDKRAYQLAYFTLMIKGRKSDRKFFKRNIQPNVCHFQDMYINTIVFYKPDSNGDLIFNYEYAKEHKVDKKIIDFIEMFHNADTYGSLIEVSGFDIDEITELVEKFEEDILTTGWKETLLKMLACYKILSQKYDICCTNPPYMGSSGMNETLSDFVKKNYPDGKSDLFACFIERGFKYAKTNGINCIVTMQSWMFLSSFEKMRMKIIESKTITNLMHMENMVMCIAFGTAVSVFINTKISNYKGTYNHVTMKDIENEKPVIFPNMQNRFAQISTENFSKIPGSPVAYWVSENFIRAFENKKLGDYAYSFQGMITGDNNYFLRLWYENNKNKLIVNLKNKDASKFNDIWIPYNKGGGFRKWYGNNEYTLRWIHNGTTLTRARTENSYYYFKEGVTWSFITSGSFSCRYFPNGYLWDVAGSSVFANSEISVYYICALLNCKVSQKIFNVINPTINYQVQNIISIPVANKDYSTKKIEDLGEDNVKISKTDWDSFETSWDFKKHPFINGEKTIKTAFEKWSAECEQRFNKLKANEEELNRIFIDIYGLQDELTPEVEDKDVTVRKADLTRDIKSFISYVVGCMFGRYSLDVDGLAYAGGEWDSTKYKSFIPDNDNCIPITDNEYFDNDIVNRFAEFVRVVYGADTLEENLDFIAKALGNKGNTSRQIIRNYFLNDFFKDHCKIYQKRPVYWLFSSGKQNGFKALVYMHRWNPDTTGNVRVEYLHKVQHIYEREIERMQEIIDKDSNSKEISKAEKNKDKLMKQLKETRDYDEKIAHLALLRIDIDLDDGVKVNYEKVQTADNKKLEILAKI